MRWHLVPPPPAFPQVPSFPPPGATRAGMSGHPDRTKRAQAGSSPVRIKEERAPTLPFGLGGEIGPPQTNSKARGGGGGKDPPRSQGLSGSPSGAGFDWHSLATYPATVTRQSPGKATRGAPPLEDPGRRVLGGSGLGLCSPSHFTCGGGGGAARAPGGVVSPYLAGRGGVPTT